MTPLAEHAVEVYPPISRADLFGGLLLSVFVGAAVVVGILAVAAAVLNALGIAPGRVTP